MKKICLALTAALTLTLTTAHAADFDKGFAAYEAGDYATAFVEFSELAEQGDADAQYNLALMYERGEGVVQDYAAAVKWYTLAAEQGDADAQFLLGAMYALGAGVVQDYALAHMWANIAAANGASNGAKIRDWVAEELSKSEITAAQRMASECMASNYANCGY
jgi:TPR repeat protein